jgi:hypothetical protein
MGASSKGKSGSRMLPIFTIIETANLQSKNGDKE